MLKKTMTTVDFGGTERTEDYYFNLTKAEIMEMQLCTDDAGNRSRSCKRGAGGYSAEAGRAPQTDAKTHKTLSQAVPRR